MRMRRVGQIGLLAGLFLITNGATNPLLAQKGQMAAQPKWQYAHDLRVRKGGEKDFTKDTPKFGVEFFLDPTAKALVAITQTGQLAVAGMPPLGKEKTASWLFAHDLRVRKHDEQQFTPATTKFGVEVFEDKPSGKLIYISEKGGIALAPAPATLGKDADPKWHHALVLKVRGPNETAFSDASKKFGIEVFKDQNTSGLIYITETGSVTAAPAPPAAPPSDQVKPPKSLYGLSLRVRKPGEADFTNHTKSLGVEVFRDDNTGGLLYITETGSIAAAPAPKELKSNQGVKWMHAMELKARPGGETDFGKAAVYGIEVFLDNNSGYLIYANNAGGIAVLPQ